MRVRLRRWLTGHPDGWKGRIAAEAWWASIGGRRPFATAEQTRFCHYARGHGYAPTLITLWLLWRAKRSEKRPVPSEELERFRTMIARYRRQN